MNLYLKAQLAIAYSTGFSITKDEKYKAVVEDILLYVTRDMTHPSGGFYAAMGSRRGRSVPTLN